MPAALSPQDLSQLPPSIQQIINSQQAGAGSPDPNVKQLGDSTVNDLNTALQRRFGQSSNYDSTFDSGVRGLMGEVPGIQNQYEQGTQRQNEDFMTNAQRIGQQSDLANGRQQNAMADQGMGYSGANLLGQQRLGEALQQNVFGANQSRNRGISDLTGRLQGQLQGISSREQALEGQATERATVADQTQAWQAQQQAMEQQALKAQQDQAAAQLQQEQQAAEQQQAALAALEAQARQSVQPIPGPTGALSGGGGAPQAPPVDWKGQTPTNKVQIDHPGWPAQNLDLTNAKDVKNLQLEMLNNGFYTGADKNNPYTGQFDQATQQALSNYMYSLSSGTGNIASGSYVHFV